MTSNGISTTPHQMLPYSIPQYVADGSFVIGDEDQDNPPSSPKNCYPSSSSFPLSPPTFDHDLFLTAYLTTTDALEAPTLSPPDPAAVTDIATNVPLTTRGSWRRRKRPFRTDRHSKIHTAQGLRDRRMRLSLEVARKFFDLQDLLGFDKASQTVDWLLTQSKSAIEYLINVSQLERQSINLSSLVSESSISECDVLSAISDDKQKSTAASPKAKDIALLPLSAAASDIQAKEMRDKARARARERTSEKKRIRSGRPEDSCSRQVQPSSKADAVKEGACINGVYQLSPLTTVPSWLTYNNNITSRLLDVQMNMNFPSNIEEGLVLADVRLQARSMGACNNPTI